MGLQEDTDEELHRLKMRLVEESRKNDNWPWTIYVFFGSLLAVGCLFNMLSVGLDVFNGLGLLAGAQKWVRFSRQFGGLAKVDLGFGYAANFSSSACIA